jgi:hypothetical protein
VSPTTSAARGPVIVLIGGPMTLESGDIVDSRQSFTDDQWSVVTHRTLAKSPLWWQTALSVVIPVLNEAGPDAFSLVLATQRLSELSSDGSLRARSLASYLPGETTTMQLSQVNDRYPAPEGSTLLSPDLAVNLGAHGARWRFVKYPWHLEECASVIAADAIIDADRWPYVPRKPHETFSDFEDARIYGDVVLVMPHTAASEAFCKGYTEWIAGGGKGGRKRKLGLSASQDPERNNPQADAAVPISAQFSATGLVSDGQWSDPADFEAARSLLQSRYDLNIGLWDLVSNPTLRRSLLSAAPVPQVSAPAISIPPPVVAREKAKIAKGAAKKQNRADAKEAIQKIFMPHGWRMDRAFMYPLVDWHGQLEDNVLLRLTLNLSDHLMRITVCSEDWEHCPVAPYVTARAAALEQIAAPDTCRAREGKDTVWQSAGGWADEVDWDERVAEIAERMPRWVEVFAELATACRESQRAKENTQIEWFKKNGIPERSWRM